MHKSIPGIELFSLQIAKFVWKHPLAKFHIKNVTKLAIMLLSYSVTPG